jgi:hypothetical protein
MLPECTGRVASRIVAVVVVVVVWGMRGGDGGGMLRLVER